MPVNLFPTSTTPPSQRQSLLQRKPNVGKRPSLSLPLDPAAMSRPMTAQTTSSSTAYTHLFDSTNMTRDDAPTSGTQTSHDSISFGVSPSGAKDLRAERHLSMASFTPETSPATRRYGVVLRSVTPSEQSPTSRPSSYYGDFRTPQQPIKNAFSKSRRLSKPSPRSHAGFQRDSPVRTKTAKELISHFESSAPSIMMSSSRAGGSRQEGPLPALPLPDPGRPMSPNRSPIRSLMSMIGFGGKQKSKDEKPLLKRRALLAEDDVDAADIPSPRNSAVGPSRTRPHAEESNYESRDFPLYALPPSGSGPLVLRSGPLLYSRLAHPNSLDAPKSTWFNTQATLQSLSLTLSNPHPMPLEEAYDTPPFRRFSLRNAAVESLPPVLIETHIATRLQLTNSPSPRASHGVTLYVFQITLPGSEVIPASKEIFAATSAWERGKWVCQIWDAISATNGTSDVPNTSTSNTIAPESSDASHPTNRAASEDSHGSSHTTVCQVPTTFDEADPQTYRVEPPLRVINASTLGSRFELDSIKSRRSWISPDEAGCIRMRRTESAAESCSNGTERSTTSSVTFPQGDRFDGPKTAPLDTTFLDGDSMPKKVDDMEARSRSVPTTPSVQDLKGMSLVQQRLASYESRENALPPLTQRSPSKTSSYVRSSYTTSPQRNIGLNTPPISPTKPLIWQHLTRAPSESGSTATAMSRYSTQSSIGMSRFDASSQGVEMRDSSLPSPLKTSFTPNPSVLEPFSRVRSELGDLSASEARPPAERRPPDQETKADSRSFPGDEEISEPPNLIAPSQLPPSNAPTAGDLAIGSLLKLVKSTAGEQAAQAKALQAHLAELKTEIKATTKPAQLQDGSKTPNPSQPSSFLEFEHALDQVQSKLNQVLLKQDSPAVLPSDIDRSLESFKQEMLSQQTEGFGAIESKLALLQNVDDSMRALQNLSSSDREAWSSKLDGLIGSLQKVDIATVNERLDGMRASLAVLEAVAKGQQGALPTRPPSAFRDTSRAPPSLTVDLSLVHQKLDALVAVPPNLPPTDTDAIKTTLDSILEVATNIFAKVDDSTVAMKDGSKDSPDDLQSLLKNLQEDQASQEKYFTDLNAWLQNSANQTSTQYHGIATQMQQLNGLLSPVDENPDADVDTGQTLFHDIRSALSENNARAKSNENFLAAANHLLGSASTERQSLVALLTTQREDNERMMAQFAVQITNEIRGQKHSFVDAMEKATALNVEGQLRELKAQISDQLLDMAKSTERLIGERKALEHQIAELLTFKTRFTSPDVQQRLALSPGQYIQPAQTMPQRAPPQPAQRPPPQQMQEHRYPDAFIPVLASPLPSSSAGSGRPLPSPRLSPRG